MKIATWKEFLLLNFKDSLMESFYGIYPIGPMNENLRIKILQTIRSSQSLHNLHFSKMAAYE